MPLIEFNEAKVLHLCQHDIEGPQQPRLTSPHLRPRRHVSSSLAHIRIDHNAGVTLRRITRNAGQKVAARRCGTGARDLELCAFGVELRGVGLVEREQLVADEVVAGCEAGRDGAGPLELLEDVVVAPGGAGEGRGGHALLVDLLHLR